MIKEFCDICGNEINTGDDYEYKVKVKKKVYSWTESWWHSLSVCEYCKKAIVEKSKQLRSRNDKSRNN